MFLTFCFFAKENAQLPWNTSIVMNGNFVNLTLTKCNGTKSHPVHVCLQYPGSDCHCQTDRPFFIDIKVSLFDCAHVPALFRTGEERRVLSNLQAGCYLLLDTKHSRAQVFLCVSLIMFRQHQ